METKICTRCKEKKEITEYYIRKDRNNQIKAMCKTCENKRFEKPIPIVGDLEGEIWKDIEEFKGFYMVSNKNRVKRILHRKHPTNTIMKIGKNKQDYRQLVLTMNGIQYCRRLNRLVAIAFIPNPENKPEVNHLKGKEDNTPESLEWSTTLENIRHAWETGLSKPQNGTKNGNSILTEKEVLEIRAIKGMTKRDIGVLYNIGEAAVGKIINRQRWTHI